MLRANRGSSSTISYRHSVPRVQGTMSRAARRPRVGAPCPRCFFAWACSGQDMPTHTTAWAMAPSVQRGTMSGGGMGRSRAASDHPRRPMQPRAPFDLPWPPASRRSPLATMSDIARHFKSLERALEADQVIRLPQQRGEAARTGTILTRRCGRRRRGDCKCIVACLMLAWRFRCPRPAAAAGEPPLADRAPSGPRPRPHLPEPSW